MPLQQSSGFFPIHGGDVQRRHAINIFTRDPKHLAAGRQDRDDIPGGLLQRGCILAVSISYLLPLMRSYLSALLTALIATFTLAAPALAQTAPAVIKNIKTDFGATCNGVANDSRAFVNFNAWARRWQQGNSGLIELDIPSGSVCTPFPSSPLRFRTAGFPSVRLQSWPVRWSLP